MSAEVFVDILEIFPTGGTLDWMDNMLSMESEMAVFKS